MNIIGKNIRTHRQKNGWSQGDVAKRLNISIPAFSKIETGKTDVNISRLNQVAALFRVSPQSIMIEPGNDPSSVDQRIIIELRKEVSEKDAEIVKLQKKVIDLYEETRNN